MRKIKKAPLIALLALALCAVLAFSVSALDDPADCSHPNLTYEDSYYDCTSDYRVYSCPDCGDSWDDVIIGVNNHRYEGEQVESPTCTTSGKTEYTCQICGDSYIATTPPSGHEYNEQYHAPTCSEKGWSNGVCAYCGDITYEEGYYVEYPPTGYHVYVDGKCSECGISVGDTCVHDFGYVSCGAETHISKCGKCGLSQGEELGHNFKREVISTEETEVKARYTCTVCGYTYTQTEDLTCDGNHNWTYYKVDNNNHRQECMTCGTTGVTSPHRWDNGVVDQAPTFGVEGYLVYSCLDCNAKKEEITPALTINDVLNRCTNKEAVQLFDALYNKFKPVINTDSATVTILEMSGLSKFAEEIFADILNNGEGSKYYDDYVDIYSSIQTWLLENSSEYQRGYNDAIGSVIDKNPIQGLIQGMWSSVILFITTVGNGVAIGGISFMSVLMTILILALVWFLIKTFKG